MKINKLPKQYELIESMDYDPETGIFIWKKRKNLSYNQNSRWEGRRAGTAGLKSKTIILNGISYAAHRLAWVYVYGDTLDENTQIDHINCNPFDNRIRNLRMATHGQNCTNSRGWRKKSLPKGVSTQIKSGGYRARIGVDGKVINLGTYPTPEEAHNAYMKAAVTLKGSFARAI